MPSSSIQPLHRFSRTALAALLLCPSACEGAHAPALSRSSGALRLGESVPAASESATVGRPAARVQRGDRAYQRLVRFSSDSVVFKNEEGTHADRRMSRRCYKRLRRLAELVTAQWPGVRVRVTEAWDEDGEHSPKSTHYEGRALDLTTSDLDPDKLGRLAYLAVRAGFDWVYFENRSHIHVSVR